MHPALLDAVSPELGLWVHFIKRVLICSSLLSYAPLFIYCGGVLGSGSDAAKKI